jgi:serine/threonine protein kinase
LVGAARTEIYGPFEVLERLGIGGMATVHRAIERGIEGFERVVALKRLLPHLAEDEGFVRAFVREAKLASLLQHGNIVQLYELGRVGPSYFISMEYIPGRDLRVILRQARRVCGPPPVEIALAILTELLDALDYAHSQVGSDGKPLGLVHRDISPSNLIVSHTGHLKVIDFGIAKATLGHLMTHTGRIKGKLSYMAPEALSGRTLDGRSDLFSASVIAHELLTASPLFAAKDDFQTIDKLQNMQPAPPSARNPSCPPELDAIVLRGLAKDPTQRWRSASEMRAALAGFAIDQHRLATNREVCDWVEEAFEMPLPSRMRLPLGPSMPAPVAASQSTGSRRTSSPPPEADDEVMDIVWGVTGPRSPMSIVLDEVPDVSERFSRADPESPDLMDIEPRDPFEPIDPLDSLDPLDPLDPMRHEAFAASLAMAGEDEPTNAMARPSLDPPPRAGAGAIAAKQASQGDPRRSSSRSQLISLASVAAADQEPRNANGGRGVARPAEWPVGTAPTTQQPPGDLLEQALEAARRGAAVTAKPATTTFIGKSSPPKPSLVPLLIASVAVAAAGAAVAWIVSGGDGDQQGQVAAALPAPAQAQVQPLPQDGQGSAAAPARAGTAAAEPADRAALLDEQTQRVADLERSRAREPRKPQPQRRVRARRDEADARGGRYAGDEARGDDGVALPGDGPEPPGKREREDDAGAESTSPGPDGADGTRAPATAKAPRPGATGAAPKPAVTAAAPTPAQTQATQRPRGPLIVPPSRTRRVSGASIQFPNWDEVRKVITAKLCIDARGRVSSVMILSPLSARARLALERAISTWTYEPVVEASEKVAACFATTFRIEVK